MKSKIITILICSMIFTSVATVPKKADAASTAAIIAAAQQAQKYGMKIYNFFRSMDSWKPEVETDAQPTTVSMGEKSFPYCNERYINYKPSYNGRTSTKGCAVGVQPYNHFNMTLKASSSKNRETIKSFRFEVSKFFERDYTECEDISNIACQSINAPSVSSLSQALTGGQGVPRGSISTTVYMIPDDIPENHDRELHVGFIPNNYGTEDEPFYWHEDKKIGTFKTTSKNRTHNLGHAPHLANPAARWMKVGLKSRAYKYSWLKWYMCRDARGGCDGYLKGSVMLPWSDVPVRPMMVQYNNYLGEKIANKWILDDVDDKIDSEVVGISSPISDFTLTQGAVLQYKSQANNNEWRTIKSPVWTGTAHKGELRLDNNSKECFSCNSGSSTGIDGDNYQPSQWILASGKRYKSDIDSENALCALIILFSGDKDKCEMKEY